MKKLELSFDKIIQHSFDSVKRKFWIIGEGVMEECRGRPVCRPAHVAGIARPGAGNVGEDISSRKRRDDCRVVVITVSKVVFLDGDKKNPEGASGGPLSVRAERGERPAGERGFRFPLSPDPSLLNDQREGYPPFGNLPL